MGDAPEPAAHPAVAGLGVVSRAIVSEAELSTVLDEIARQAAWVIGARTASILLLSATQTFRLAGAHGLSAGYGAFLADPETELRPGRGPAGIALTSGRPVNIADVRSDDRADRWRAVAAAEGYRAMLAVPLGVNGRTLGAITAYRDRPGEWSRPDVEMLSLFAAHAGSAVFVAQLVASQRRHVAGLSQMVRTMRDQTHEHANRLHAISGLLALGEAEEARRYVEELESMHHTAYGSLVGRIGNPAVAGLVHTQIGIAEQRGVSLRLDARSSYPAGPVALGDAEAVTILGSMVDHALEAVGGLPRARRRITLSLRADAQRAVLRVRDRAPRPEGAGDSGPPGAGLALAMEALASVNGTMTLERGPNGTTAVATVPAPHARASSLSEPCHRRSTASTASA